METPQPYKTARTQPTPITTIDQTFTITSAHTDESKNIIYTAQTDQQRLAVKISLTHIELILINPQQSTH